MREQSGEVRTGCIGEIDLLIEEQEKKLKEVKESIENLRGKGKKSEQRKILYGAMVRIEKRIRCGHQIKAMLMGKVLEQ